MTDAPSTTVEARRPHERRLKALLTASFAVNLLVLGAVAGVAMGLIGKQDSYRGGRGEDFGLMGFSRTLPTDRKKEIRRVIRQERGVLKPLFADIDRMRAEAAQILATEPFDREAFKQALERVASGEDKLKHAVMDVVLTTADKLSPEERKALSQWWENRRAKDADFRKHIETKMEKEGAEDAPPKSAAPAQ